MERFGNELPQTFRSPTFSTPTPSYSTISVTRDYRDFANSIGSMPPTFVAKVREIRPLGPDAALLRSVAGMLPPGGDNVDPKLNVSHVLVAARRAGEWRIVHFQNTPARFDGRPEQAEALTAELQAVVAG